MSKSPHGSVLRAAILTTALIAYRRFNALPISEKEAVLAVLAEHLPDHDQAAAAEQRLFNLREGDKQQLKLDSIMHEIDRVQGESL